MEVGKTPESILINIWPILTENTCQEITAGNVLMMNDVIIFPNYEIKTKTSEENEIKKAFVHISWKLNRLIMSVRKVSEHEEHDQYHTGMDKIRQK